MLVLGSSQVESLLDMDALIDALAPAMVDLSAGRASVPDRVAAQVPAHDGFLAAMPGFLPSAGVLMTKLVSLSVRRVGKQKPHRGAACGRVLRRCGPGPGGERKRISRRSCHRRHPRRTRPPAAAVRL